MEIKNLKICTKCRRNFTPDMNPYYCNTCCGVKDEWCKDGWCKIVVDFVPDENGGHLVDENGKKWIPLEKE